jgi:integrase
MRIPAMTATNLTDQIAKRLPPPAHGYSIAWDAKVAGFGIRITAAGAKAFILNYRTRGGRARRFTIGSFPEWTVGAARTEAAELRKQIDRGGDPLGEIQAGRKAPTVSDLCERFADEHLPRLKPSTQISYRGHIASEIIPNLGSMKVSDVAFADVDRLHRKISKRGVPYRANRVMATLSKMFTLAVRWQMRTDNPCESVEHNTEHKRRRYLSAAELSRLTTALANLKDQQSANIIRLLLLTGARRGEVLAARWADIDLATGTWSKPGSSTKQKTEHSVPLGAGARALLAGLRAQAPADEWVFPAPRGGHRKDVKDSWETLRRTGNLKDARTHDLRHTFASVLASGGQSLPVIGALLGHSAPATTARYSHLFDDPLRRAIEQADAILSGQPSAEIVPLPVRHQK